MDNSLADAAWASGQFGEPYTMEQAFSLLESVKKGTIDVPQEIKEKVLPVFENDREMPEIHLNREVQIWPQIAWEWIRTVLNFL